MAKIYKKICYRPVPKGAKVIEGDDGKQYAYWIDKDGEEYTALYTVTKNGPRILEESSYYVARFTDATGRYRERSTGCGDLRAAQHKLNSWLQEVDKVKAGILTQEEFEISKRVNDAIENHFEDFELHLRAKGATARYIREILSRIRKVCDACRFKRFIDLNSNTLLRWLNQQFANGMGARTRNVYRGAMNNFSNWAVKNSCMASNPFQRVPEARESIDKRHERRALNAEEIVKLLKAAEDRPLYEVTLVRRGKRRGECYANVRPEVREAAARLGLERKLLYATLIYTGLRKSELASITIGRVFLDHEVPHFALAAKNEKSKRGATLPLHPELVVELRKWLELKQGDGELSPKEKLFNVPFGLCKILNRDLAYAGIEKRDGLDRVVDVHALRHTHGTLLAKRGVSPTVAKNSMRHSDIRMTMNLYTHLDLDDVAEGVNRIPDFLNGDAEKK
jgi:integrase